MTLQHLALQVTGNASQLLIATNKRKLQSALFFKKKNGKGESDIFISVRPLAYPCLLANMDLKVHVSSMVNDQCTYKIHQWGQRKFSPLMVPFAIYHVIDDFL